MKIIFLNRYFYPDHSATSQLLTDLSFALAVRGWQVSVITSCQGIDNENANFSSWERINGVSVYRVWTTRFGRTHLLGRAIDYLTFYLSAALELVQLCRPGDIAVAKTDPPLISIPTALVCRVRGGRQVNWLHDLFPEVATALGVGFFGDWMSTGLKWLRNRSLRSAEMNIVLGERMAEYVASQGVRRERIQIIHNWCTGDVTPIKHKDNPLKRAWDLSRDFVVAYSGNMGRAHEFNTILDAAAELQDARVKFLFIGGGAQRQWIETEAKARGLSNVVMHPYQSLSALGRSLAVGDVHWVSLVPEVEGLIVPSKLYGILAAGRACLFVGDTEGEVAQLLDRHGCGETVAIGDSARLATIIRSWAGEPVRCEALGLAARRAFDTHYESQWALRAWSNVFNSMVAGSATHP